ncbi:ABC transporter E family member 2 [Platanthera guangdongensis]|uniref:ABC transporter E family member 2 n=1 Tax=Platanthera guangdongensis TaxID=2320717 RepID=A0ABR2LUB6_9ASPA
MLEIYLVESCREFAIAVVAVQNAEIYMFDEPSSYLDVRQRLKAAQVVRSLLRPNRDQSRNSDTSSLRLRKLLRRVLRRFRHINIIEPKALSPPTFGWAESSMPNLVDFMIEDIDIEIIEPFPQDENDDIAIQL